MKELTLFNLKSYISDAIDDNNRGKMNFLEILDWLITWDKELEENKRLFCYKRESIKRGEKPEPDDFRGEQAFFFNLKGKGLVVLSGCAHSGIVNTVKQAQKISGVEKIHAVLGGFHLINAKPEIIQRTVADIKALKPDYVVPTHCTGFEAIVAFKQEMPGEFIINTAGT